MTVFWTKLRDGYGEVVFDREKNHAYLLESSRTDCIDYTHGYRDQFFKGAKSILSMNHANMGALQFDRVNWIKNYLTCSQSLA